MIINTYVKIRLNDLIEGIADSKSRYISHLIVDVCGRKKLSKGKLRKWMFKIFHYMNEDLLNIIHENLSIFLDKKKSKDDL